MEKTKKLKIAVFGGSFDPPHYGHYDIVKNLEKLFDSVIVVPSCVSPFKTGADDGRARLRLCKKLFTSEKTQVLGREITRGGISYSVDTAAYLYKKYGNLGGVISWVIGTEELVRLDEWHDIDRLKKLVTFLAVPRPGYEPKKEKLAALKKRGIKIKIAKFSGLDVSSTLIKIDAAFGKPNKHLPSFVADYAKKHALFDPYSRYVRALYDHDVGNKRLAHTYGVAVRGAELAKAYGASVNDAVIACILHDIAKHEKSDDYEDRVDVKGFPEPTMHAPIGAYIARTELHVSSEIEHAIRYHATGCGEMSLLDEVVYLADKTESGRSYNEVYLFRYLCSLDKNLAMFATLYEVEKFKGNAPCEYTEAALAYYKKLCAGKQIPELPKREAPVIELPNTKLPAVRHKAEVGKVQSKAVGRVDVKSRAVRIIDEAPKTPVPVGENTFTGDATPEQIADAVARELLLHKGHDVDVVDLSGKTIIADYFILASATSTTAVKALVGYVEDRMTKSFGLDPTRRDIDKEWAALDYGSIIVHIFTDKTREFYNIERLWSDGSNITRYND